MSLNPISDNETDKKCKFDFIYGNGIIVAKVCDIIYIK